MHFSMNTAQVVFALTATVCFAMPNNSKLDDLMCMDTPRHKAKPTSEIQLHKSCSAYEGLSCCTNDTAARIHGDNLYKFQNVVCKNKELSSECKKYFLKDACFYECSPDIAAYVSYEEGKSVLKKVPLCQTNCDNWFAACQNDFTCTKDWKKAMKTESSCSAADKCQTVKDKFQNAKDFCEKVWQYSYAVVGDEEKCLRFDEPEKRDPADVKKLMADKHGEQKGDDDCHKEKTVSSSPSIKYHIILGGFPFVLSYFFIKSVNYNL